MLLSCVAPSKITVNPQSQLVYEGHTLILSCEATGSGPISYQWRRVNGEISSDRAEGVNTPTLTISPVTEGDEDEYYCVASNDVRDESKTAVVAVLSKDTGTSMTCLLYSSKLSWQKTFVAKNFRGKKLS